LPMVTPVHAKVKVRRKINDLFAAHESSA